MQQERPVVEQFWAEAHRKVTELSDRKRRIEESTDAKPWQTEFVEQDERDFWYTVHANKTLIEVGYDPPGWAVGIWQALAIEAGVSASNVNVGEVAAALYGRALAEEAARRRTSLNGIAALNSPLSDDLNSPKPKRKIPKSEAEVLVADYLREHKDEWKTITRAQIHKATDVSEGGVSNTVVWKAFDAEREKRLSGKVREVSLSVGMQEEMADGISRPEHAAELRELIEQQQKENEADDRKYSSRPAHRHKPS